MEGRGAALSSFEGRPDSDVEEALGFNDVQRSRGAENHEMGRMVLGLFFGPHHFKRRALLVGRPSHKSRNSHHLRQKSKKLCPIRRHLPDRRPCRHLTGPRAT